MNNLVNAFDGENSRTEFSSSYGSDSSNCSSSSCENHGFSEQRVCHERAQTQQHLEHLDIAREQLSVARGKVEKTLEQSVEAKLNDTPDLPEKLVKKAEQEQDELVRAEGKLDRTESQVTAHQDQRYQAKNEFELKRRAAEDRVLQKFGSASPELRQELLKKLRPQINHDAARGADPKQLEEAAKWFVKNDSKGQRLKKEGDAQSGRTGPKGDYSKPERRKELAEKLRGKLKDSKPEERSGLLEQKLKPLAKDSPQAAQDLEQRLTEQFSQVEKAEAQTNPASALGGKSQRRKRQAVDRLLERKSQRMGKAGAEADSLTRSVEKLDSESVKQTSRILDSLDTESVTSQLDLERKFGRDVSTVRRDLEQQINRGGESVSRARKTLKRLDKVVKRSKLVGSKDLWSALRQSTGSRGPNLGRFLGVPEGESSSKPYHKPALNQRFEPGHDTGVTGTLLRRLAQSGSKVDERSKRETLLRTGQVSGR